MGEAKRRGNYEQRVQEGIEKELKLSQEKKRIYDEQQAKYEASLTPAQKTSRTNRNTLLLAAAALAASM